MDIKEMEEIVNKYKYLYLNKEIILALCIEKRKRFAYYKKEIEKTRKLLEECKKKHYDKSAIYFLTYSICEYEKKLFESDYYLLDDINTDLRNMLQEFIMTSSIEESRLYKLVEEQKRDKETLHEVRLKIEGLKKRRSGNSFLEKRECITVWRILNYVRSVNLSNTLVLDKLDIYYNLDRFIKTGIDFKCGYFIKLEELKEYEEFFDTLPNDYIALIDKEYRGTMSLGQENEYEKEDDYCSIKEKIKKKSYLPLNVKNELYLELKGPRQVRLRRQSSK